MNSKFSFVFVAIALLLSGCDKHDRLPAKALWKELKADYESWKLRRTESVILRVGDRVITEEDIDTLMSRDPQLVSQIENEEIRKKITETLQSNLQMVLAAEKMGFGADPEFLRMRREATEQALGRIALERIQKGISVSAKEKHDFYIKEKSNYSVPMIYLSVIRVKAEKDAEAAQNHLKQGKPFSLVAEKLSVDPVSKKKGGKLPPRPANQLPPLFWEKIKAMRPGETTPPLQSGGGYEIFRLDKVEPGPPLPFQMVEKQIEQFLKQQQTKKMVDEILQR